LRTLNGRYRVVTEGNSGEELRAYLEVFGYLLLQFLSGLVQFVEGLGLDVIAVRSNIELRLEARHRRPGIAKRAQHVGTSGRLVQLGDLSQHGGTRAANLTPQVDVLLEIASLRHAVDGSRQLARRFPGFLLFPRLLHRRLPFLPLFPSFSNRKSEIANHKSLSVIDAVGEP